MRIYLVLADPQGRVHGVDYVKGLEKADGTLKECGRVHEFQTRGCHPVYITDDDPAFSGYKAGELMEIVPFRKMEAAA